MKRERKGMPKVVVISQYFLCSFYIIFGIFGYLARGPDNVVESFFELYQTSDSFMKYLWLTYILVTPFDIPFYAISASEYFEDLKMFQSLIRDQEGEILRYRLVILRLLVFFSSSLILIVAGDLTSLIAIGGACMSIGLCLLPVSILRIIEGDFWVFL